MKISSRPKPLITNNSGAIGTGPHIVHLTDTQLELITALVYQCRLGQPSPYSAAAFELSEMIDVTFGTDYGDDACTKVCLEVTIEDAAGGVVLSTKSGSYYPTLEV